MREIQNLVYVSFDGGGIPCHATLFRGEVVNNVGPDRSRMVAQGRTEDNRPIMRWADRGNILPFFNDELPAKLASETIVSRSFGEYQINFIVERTPRGHRIASLERVKIEPASPTSAA